MKKDEQIRMLLHPEKYTDEQLDQMLDETSAPMPDVNREWTKFEAEHFGSERRKAKGEWRLFLKMAAMFVGVLMLSGIAYAAINHLVLMEENPKITILERKPDIKKVKDTYGVEMTPTKKAPVIFNNVELQQIMQYVADGYGVKVAFKNKAARTVRFYLQWEAEDTLQEIIDKINHFEKVHLTLNEETITIE